MTEAISSFTVVDNRQETVIVKGDRMEEDSATGRLRIFDGANQTGSFAGYQSCVKNN